MNTESKTYFASDGSYGDAESLEVLDTTAWTHEDWQEIDEAGDIERVSLAREIERKYK